MKNFNLKRTTPHHVVKPGNSPLKYLVNLLLFSHENWQVSNKGSSWLIIIPNLKPAKVHPKIKVDTTIIPSNEQLWLMLELFKAKTEIHSISFGIETIILLMYRVSQKKVPIGSPKPQFLSETFEIFTVGRLFYSKFIIFFRLEKNWFKGAQIDVQNFQK